MTNSEKPYETIDLDALSIYEKDIEEIVVDSYSEEDYEDEIIPQPQTKLLAKDKEYERRKNICLMYNVIQKLLGSGDADEPQLRILKKATAACKHLCQEELSLKLETEVLLQKNWKLKRRVEKLQRKKRRKSGSATITRRSSGPPISSPNKTNSIEKRSVSVDECKLVILQNTTADKMSTSIEIEENSNEEVLSPALKTPKRKVKKRSGLSEEEKEFYKVEEKIEDLLSEIDVLWNDVNNDEEKEGELEDKNILGNNVHLDDVPLPAVAPSGPSQEIYIPKHKEKIKLADINKLIEPELNAVKCRETIKVTSVTKSRVAEPQYLKNREIIKIANINKILDPVQNPIIRKHSTPNFECVLEDKRRSSTSGDESPKLIIDENPGSQRSDDTKLAQTDIDVIEALQAVDTLCLSLVSDEPTTSETRPIVVEINKANTFEKSDVIAISDSEDETANSDIVCIE